MQHHGLCRRSTAVAQRAALAHIVVGMVQRRPDLLRVADTLLSSLTVRAPPHQAWADCQPACGSSAARHIKLDLLHVSVMPVEDREVLI